MKTLLTLLFMALGSVAFANNGDNTGETTTTEKTAAVKIVKKDKEKDTVKAIIAEQPATRAATRRNNCSTCTGLDAKFDLGSYFAEFINRSNQKLVKLILTE